MADDFHIRAMRELHELYTRLLQDLASEDMTYWEWQIAVHLLQYSMKRTELATEVYESSRLDAAAAASLQDYLGIIDKAIGRGVLQYVSPKMAKQQRAQIKIDRIPNCADALSIAGDVDLTDASYHFVQRVRRKLFHAVPAGHTFDERTNTALVIGLTSEACQAYVTKVLEMQGIHLTDDTGRGYVQRVSSVGPMEPIGPWRYSRFEICPNGVSTKIWYTDEYM